MKRLWYLLLPLLLVLAALFGCGTSGTSGTGTEHPNEVGVGGPAKALIHNPTVVIIGDSVVQAWGSQNTNPLWTFQGSPAGVQETTEQILARFGQATALHPDIIVIEAGVYDVAQWAAMAGTGTGGVSPCTAPVPNACTNIQQMITEATNAGVYVIVCTIPPWGIGPAAGVITVAHASDIQIFNETFISSLTVAVFDANGVLFDNGYPNGLGEIQIYLYSPNYTTDGVNPNAAGAAVMTQALTIVVQNSQVGGAR